MRVFISHPFLPEQKFGCNEMEIFGTSSRGLIAIINKSKYRNIILYR
jgi:hypothetical protein